LSGGGHYIAAGFSIKDDKIPELIAFLKKEITHTCSSNELYADCFLTISTATSVPFMEMLGELEPFGTGNRHPKFVIKNVEIISPMAVGRGHIRAILDDGSGKILRTIAFKSCGTNLENIMFNYKRPINVLGSLTMSEWKGKKHISMTLEDIADGDYEDE
ncbi:MAG: hypothetical protein LBB15_00520, partial [Puniceicoccales bacterium]|jgi:single-stranded-DNA-specific exonuclease|nr:hypothetical protein [Puniceicoccales bacterium]